MKLVPNKPKQSIATVMSVADEITTFKLLLSTMTIFTAEKIEKIKKMKEVPMNSIA
jgi:hypothetical protein